MSTIRTTSPLGRGLAMLLNTPLPRQPQPAASRPRAAGLGHSLNMTRVNEELSFADADLRAWERAVSVGQSVRRAKG